VPRVSVVIPTRDRLPLLSQTLATLLAQTETDIEIVVADNASSDGTAAWVCSRGDPRLRLARCEPAVPQMANWNRALGLARADYVALYHDDDLYHPEIVARCAAVLDAHPSVGLVHTAATRLTQNGAEAGPVRAAVTDFVRPGRGEALRWLAEIHDVVPSSTLLRRSVVEAVGGFVEDQLYADFDFYVRMALRADVAYLAAPLVHVRLHPHSTTRRFPPERWLAEVEQLVPRLRAAAEAGGLEPASGWDETFRSLRARFAGRLLNAATALLAEGAGGRDLVAGYLSAARALDPGTGTRLRAGLVSACNRPLCYGAVRGGRALYRRATRRRFSGVRPTAAASSRAAPPPHTPRA
jgi:GT2 family glycosyltransferase